MKTLLAFSVFFLASMFNALGGVDILKAARDGDPKAQIAMAAELIKTNQPDKIAEGIEWLKKSAESGFAPAQNWLGIIYGEGRFVKRDFEEAIKWREKAATNGTPADKWALGNTFFAGFTLPRDWQRGLYWIESAAEDGLKEAMERSAEVRAKMGDSEREKYWKDKLAKVEFEEAKNGNSASMFKTSKRLLKGENGFQKNLPEGIYWLKSASDAGNSDASEYLASLYMRGKYVSKNFDMGLEIYEKLAKKNPAYYAQISALYGGGKYGFPTDEKKAREYLEKYAELGNPAAVGSTRKYLAWIYWKDKNTEKALYWCEKYMDEIKKHPDSQQTIEKIVSVAKDIAGGETAPEKFKDFAERF